MGVYDKLVYLTICEAAFERFKLGKFLTFGGYIRNLHNSIELNNLSYLERQDLLYIIKMVDKIYCMSFDETNRYVSDFLNLDNIQDYEKCVQMTNEFFPNSNIFL